MAQIGQDTVIALCKRVRESESGVRELRLQRDEARQHRDLLLAECAERGMERDRLLEEIKNLQAEIEKWRFCYNKSEERCDAFREDAYDHFVTSEALRARLVALVAAGRTDVEI